MFNYSFSFFDFLSCRNKLPTTDFFYIIKINFASKLLALSQKFVLPLFRALAALEPERAVNCLFKIGLGLEDRLRRKLDRVVEADPDTLADAKKKGAFAKLCEMHDKGLL